MSDNSSKGLDMTQVAEVMRKHVITAGGPRAPDETVERWLERAARRLGFGYRRTRAIYHREARRIDAQEYIAARHRAAEINRLRSQVASIEAMRRDNTDALIEDARKLLGPLFDRLVAHGLVKVDGVEASKDGEA